MQAVSGAIQSLIRAHGNGLMPLVLDWQRDDPRQVVQRAVQELIAGKLVVCPSEAGYQVVALALHAQASTDLGRLAPPNATVLAIRDISDAIRWAPWMGTTARRLSRRIWPGPVTMELECPSTIAVPSLAAGTGTIRLWVPAHEADLQIMDHLGGPLLCAPLQDMASSVQELTSALGDKVALVIDDGPPGNHLTSTVIHVHGNDWTIREVGAVTAEMLEALMPVTVLFVCTGNTCRSPMAEALCKKLLADRLGCQPEELPRHGFLVLSAGLAAMIGLEAAPEAVEVAREYGADLSGHRSQPLSADLLARTDYLFTMTQSHLRALLPFCLECGPQPRLLASTGEDIRDPIGAESSVYRECAQEIFRYLQDCLPDIRPL
jgi:L-threonylcarbamoyladenylate synthase